MNAAFDKNKVPPLTTPRGFKVGETKEEGKEVLGSPTLADVKALKDHDEAGLKFDTAKVRRESRNNNSWHANTYNVPSIPFLPPTPNVTRSVSPSHTQSIKAMSFSSR